MARRDFLKHLGFITAQSLTTNKIKPVMTEQEIQQNNELIARFMGGKTKSVTIGGQECERFYMPDSHITEPVYSFVNLEYQSSWDVLMPVVQKIVNADMDTFDSYALWVSDSLRTADISQVYYSVVQYIINQPKPVNQE